MIRRWVEAKGVAVHTGARVDSIELPQPGLLERVGAAIGLGGGPAPAPMQVKLSTGAVIEADLVISATGVKPAMDFLAGGRVWCACKAC
jgi:NAD(P)H-nitrite reductase large subunit